MMILKMKRRVHFLFEIQFVAVLDGVRDGFADSHSNPVSPILIQPCVLTEMFGDHLNEFDVLDPAADGDLDSLAVPVPLHENRGHSK